MANSGFGSNFPRFERTDIFATVVTGLSNFRRVAIALGVVMLLTIFAAQCDDIAQRASCTVDEDGHLGAGAIDRARAIDPAAQMPPAGPLYNAAARLVSWRLARRLQRALSS